MPAQVKVTFKSNRAGQAKFGRSEGVYRELERRGEKAKALALALYEPHRKTGDYGRGLKLVRTRIRGKAAVQLVATAAHSALLEHGTRPHVIESHGDWPLRSADGRVFGRRVQHPGTPALHILRRALKAAGR